MGEARSGSALTWIEKAVGIAIAILGAWSAFQASIVKDQLGVQAGQIEKLRAEIARSAEEREGRKLNHDITIRIFDEVKEVYAETGLSKEQMLNRLTSVAALLEAIPDPAVRTQLAAAVRAALDNLAAGSQVLAVRAEAVKSQVDETVFRAEQSQVSDAVRQPAAPAEGAGSAEHPAWSSYDFDLFWCESGPNPEASRQAAEAAARLRLLDPNASGRWRVRKLPAAVNERAGYQINGYVIHVTSDEEARLAEIVRAAIRKANGAQAPEFTVRRSSYPSPWYISLFFCPDARRS